MAFMPLMVLAFGIVDYGEIMAQATNLTAIIRGAAEYARGQVVQGKLCRRSQRSQQSAGRAGRGVHHLRASALALIIRR